MLDQSNGKHLTQLEGTLVESHFGLIVRGGDSDLSSGREFSQESPSLVQSHLAAVDVASFRNRVLVDPVAGLAEITLQWGEALYPMGTASSA